HRENVSLPARLALGGLNFFSEYISKVDGDRCPMYPTCASYSRQVFNKHGFFMGVVMTADRLIHESSEMQYAPLVKVGGGGTRYYDPVSGNDFWWYGDKEGLDK
ncbi:MAG: membrane protein insertion efficiency factor YidD, partial [Syntrophales bacterium]|nr:membrane protein insertion efficiency factor YidD [Syntrophales bacterium]